MATEIVLTLIGQDRPGLVELLAECIEEHGGNWLKSRMARLAGKFAGVLLVSVEEQRLGELREALRGLAGRGLEVTVEATDDQGRAIPTRELRILLLGQDQPGVVRRVSRALREREINVEDLRSETLSAPMSGEMLFRARIRLSLPENADGDELTEQLETIADELHLDLTVEPVGD